LAFPPTGGNAEVPALARFSTPYCEHRRRLQSSRSSQHTAEFQLFYFMVPRFTCDAEETIPSDRVVCKSVEGGVYAGQLLLGNHMRVCIPHELLHWT